MTPFQSRTVTVTEAGQAVEFRCRLLAPSTIESGRRYPLVVFLHGAGERGRDNERQLECLPAWMAEPPLRERHPCFLLAPQCREGELWVDVSWAERKSTPHGSPTTDMLAVTAAVDAVIAAEPVDPARIYLTGLSMGGYGTWDLAARQPERFAALLPICGGGDEATAPRLAKLPIWCFHGAADDIVPVERSRSMISALRAAGGDPRYSELPGVGHDSWTPAYRDPAVLDWLFAQAK
ncbi:phospholipase [bacterium]|nr:phospholipase [bacterium]